MKIKQTFLLFAILCYGCREASPEIHSGNYFEVRNIAESSGKNIWMMLGGGTNCHQCNELISAITESEIVNKYGDDFIFYKCNTWDVDCQFLHRLFLPTAVPNSYIITPNGEVISYLLNDVTANVVERQLESALEKHPINESSHNQFKSTGKELLKMQNYLLQSFDPGLSAEKRLELLDKSISIEPCFYNLYRKYQCTKEAGISCDADSCVKNMLSYLTTTYQIVVYSNLIADIREEGNIRGDQREYPEFTTATPVKDCGRIACNKVHEIMIDYRNTGTVPLVITNIHVTCGCLQPEWSRKPLKPGDNSKLVIKFDAKSCGKFDYPISIVSNCEYKLNKISIKGRVK